MEQVSLGAPVRRQGPQDLCTVHPPVLCLVPQGHGRSEEGRGGGGEGSVQGAGQLGAQGVVDGVQVAVLGLDTTSR
eukprot:2607779-Lingulodinium_polyedra.AAC.1